MLSNRVLSQGKSRGTTRSYLKWKEEKQKWAMEFSELKLYHRERKSD